MNEDGAAGIAGNGSETFIPVDFDIGQSGALRVAGDAAKGHTLRQSRLNGDISADGKLTETSAN
ncbi:hypothetical protein J5I95_06390 [Candidatus Poribacteria bacterium]|nr:hypothetical protein [Candidatus Poribacteria bacterium]